MQYSTRYIFLFSLGLCLICSLAISVAAVSLRPLQTKNALLDKRKNVLYAAGLAKSGEKLDEIRVDELFVNIQEKVIDLETGEYVEGIDPGAVEMVAVASNPAGITKVAPQIEIYHVVKDGKVDMLILPIYGKGLWGTLYGFLALRADCNTIAGLTYYTHKETPGLGAEVDNPKWKGLWPGRKVFDAEGNVAIHVIKGPAENAQQAPHEVDGLSGATITSRGVTNMLRYWFGESGYQTYLEKFLKNEAA